MTKQYLNIMTTAFLAMAVTGCSNENSFENLTEDAETGNVTFTLKNISATRAGDTQFDTGDAIGVFASQQSGLASSGNYADNVKYIYSSYRFINAGEGIPVSKDKSYEMAYYAVYPFVDGRRPEFKFTVLEDQSTYANYTKCDLLMAATTVPATDKNVSLQFNHMLSKVMIDASALGIAESRYRIEMMTNKTSVTANLEQQSVTTVSDAFLFINMCLDGTNHHRAILPPQVFEAGSAVGQIFLDNQTARTIYVKQDIELYSGTAVEFKLRKYGNDYYLDYGGTSYSGIPDDNEATPNPDVGTPNTTIPNIQYTAEVDGNDVIVRLDMTGVQDPYTQEWIRLFGTRNPEQNIWISVDGFPKGFTVYNNEDENGDGMIKTDVIFVVDNSGSMNEEAEAVARDIMSWSQTLSQSGLDVMFACVGYSVSGTINGGIDFTNSTGLSSYLNRSSGTSRTIGFSGSNASALQASASSYHVSDECGAMAIRYANANFSFRSGANRIYVNFTDEPNQPNGNQGYSVEFFSSQSNWGTSMGTVHTVYSGYNFTERLYWEEYPWKISEYTGGTTFQTNSSFSGVNLNSLPVTGAMQHSYVIRFHNIAHLIDGQVHVIRITILSSDGRVRADRTFNVVFTLN